MSTPRCEIAEAGEVASSSFCCFRYAAIFAFDRVRKIRRNLYMYMDYVYVCMCMHHTSLYIMCARAFMQIVHIKLHVCVCACELSRARAHARTRTHTHAHTHTLRLRVQIFRLQFRSEGKRSRFRILSPGLQCLRQIYDERDQRACKCATAESLENFGQPLRDGAQPTCKWI